ncbi:ATP-binding protein [Frateuria aurantia]
MNSSPLDVDARHDYPFSALVGLDALRQFLLLAAVDPGLGGVLVSGPRGTAKSTSARALAALLPEGRMISLPLGATEERLIGSLDIEAMLRDGELRFAPGLLAAAHHGVLYVDEVNLLPDGLVDALLDVAASGINTVEREGISHSHPARFVLIGTMNPEEGELRPQLLDRFGLMVELENCHEPALRQAMVRARLDFEADPAGFSAAHASADEALRQRLRGARQALAGLTFSDAVHARVSQLAIEAGVDGVRADLAMLRAARALAAWEQADAIELEHVDRVASACLRHRAGPQAPEPRPAAMPPSSADDAAKGRTQAPGEGGPAAGRGGDAGYLPPEPVGITPVKPVRPWLPKT